MNILHLSPDLKWSQIFILPIAEKQCNEGNTVYISAPSNNSVEVNGEKIKFLNLISKLKYPKLHFLGLYKLIRESNDLSIDKVYLHTCIDSFLPIIFLRIFTNSEVIYINHGVPYDGYKGLLRLIFQLIELSNITFSHRVISITKSMTVLLEKVNFFNKKIDTFKPGTIAGIDFKIPNYDLLIKTRQKINSNQSKNILKIIYVARIEKRKGIYELIEAVNNFQSDHIHLSILGNGEDNLSNLTYDPNMINIEGYIEDITNFYLEADILIVPSYHEGFGQVYLEAASLGVIPVCSNILGPTDFVINGYNGFTVPPKNSEAITTLLSDIIQGKYDLNQIRLNAFKAAKEFDSKVVLTNNLKILNK